LIDGADVDMIDGRYPSELMLDVLKSKLGKDSKFKGVRYPSEHALEG